MRRLLQVALATGLLLAVELGGGVARAHPPLIPDLDIATLPAYANYPVTLDGQSALTDAHGVAHFRNSSTAFLSTRVGMSPHQFTLNGVTQRVVPARLYNNGRKRIIIFDVFYVVRFGFKNDNGGPLDAAEIKTLRVKNSIGDETTLPAHQASWLQGSRVVPLAGGLEVKKIYWTIQDVQYAGTNVVNSSQQRFQPADTQHVTVSLLFYSARLRVHDALFGFKRGGTILLVYPDGTRQEFRLDRHGALTLPSLPRGNYSVVIEGLGPRMTQHVAVSTNQDLGLKYYSWIDVAVVVVVVAFFTMGLLVIGIRRRRRHARVHSAETAHDEALESLGT